MEKGKLVMPNIGCWKRFTQTTWQQMLTQTTWRISTRCIYWRKHFSDTNKRKNCIHKMEECYQRWFKSQQIKSNQAIYS